jgi:hypothetical protein
MPPAQKAAPKAAVKDLLPVGKFVNLVSGGRTLSGYEVMDKDDKFVMFRASALNAPQTEFVLVPYEKLEMVGFGRE